MKRACIIFVHSRARRIDSFASRVIWILLVLFNNVFKFSKISYLSHIKTKKFVYVLYELDSYTPI